MRAAVYMMKSRGPKKQNLEGHHLSRYKRKKNKRYFSYGKSEMISKV